MPTMLLMVVVAVCATTDEAKGGDDEPSTTEPVAAPNPYTNERFLQWDQLQGLSFKHVPVSTTNL